VLIAGEEALDAKNPVKIDHQKKSENNLRRDASDDPRSAITDQRGPWTNLKGKYRK